MHRCVAVYPTGTTHCVDLMAYCTIGKGIQVSCKDEWVNLFIREFWGYRLNQMANRILGFSDELVRSGNLFLVISTDPGGMSYIRSVNTERVKEIITRENEPDQEKSFLIKTGEEEIRYPKYNPEVDSVSDCGNFELVMVHNAVNRTVGELWGESKLLHLLKWLGGYTAWLEDWVRLKRFRNAFLHVVKVSYIAKQPGKHDSWNLQAIHPGVDIGDAWERVMVGDEPQAESNGWHH